MVKLLNLNTTNFQPSLLISQYKLAKNSLNQISKAIKQNKLAKQLTKQLTKQLAINQQHNQQHNQQRNQQRNQQCNQQRN